MTEIVKPTSLSGSKLTPKKISSLIIQRSTLTDSNKNTFEGFSYFIAFLIQNFINILETEAIIVYKKSGSETKSTDN